MANKDVSIRIKKGYETTFPAVPELTRYQFSVIRVSGWIKSVYVDASCSGEAWLKIVGMHVGVADPVLSITIVRPQGS